MTIDDIKTELPDIKVNNNGTIEYWAIRGSKNKFASVINPKTLASIEASWVTIKNIIDNDKYLRL